MMDRDDIGSVVDARRLIRELVLGAKAGWTLGSVLTGAEKLPGADLLGLAPAWICGVTLGVVSDGVVEVVQRNIEGIPLNLLRLPGGYVATDTALAFTADGRGAHVDADGTYDAERFVRRALHRKDGRKKDYGEVFVLTTQYYNNYSHWITQVCASAALMLRFCDKEGITDHVFVVPFGTSATRWKIESLVAVGVPRDSIVEMGGVVIHGRSVYYCSLEFSGLAGHTRTLLVEPMSHLFEQTIAHSMRAVPAERRAALPKRVFVDRSLSGTRLLSNRAEIYSLAEEFKLNLLRLEELSFLEQVCLFAQAEVVVAEHGAGLTNLLFSSGCRVVELLPAGFGNLAYPAIAALRGLEFNRIIGSTMTSLDEGRVWSVNAASLRTALRRLGM
jgi:hypothetical protein